MDNSETMSSDSISEQESQQQQTTSSSDASAYGIFSSEDNYKFFQTKNFSTADDLMKSYRSLESEYTRGQQALKELQGKVSEVGVPEKYEIPNQPGWDENEMNNTLNMFKEVGLNNQQAIKAIEVLNNNAINNQKAQMEYLQKEEFEAHKQLQGEWGQNYGANIEFAQRGANKFGHILNANDVAAMRQTLGTAAVHKMFAEIGRMDNDVSVVTSGKSPTSPAQAHVALQNVGKNPDMLNKFFGDKPEDAVAEIKTLAHTASMFSRG